MKHSLRRQQVAMSAFMLLFFGAILYGATFLPLKVSHSSHFSAKSLKEISRITRADRLHKQGAIGSKDDPFARLNYELDRLKDPATGHVPAGIREMEMAFSAGLLTVDQVERQKNPYAQNNQYFWSRRGPYNVGGRTRALAIDAGNENIFLAGGVSGGMWRSTNSGNAWTKVTDPNQFHSVSTISQDKRVGKRNVWYYGTGEISGNSASKPGAFYYGNGVYKSIDNGITWNPLHATLTQDISSFNNVFQFVHRIVTNPTNPTQDDVFAATVAGIQRSTNGGATWFPVLGTDDLKFYSSSPYYTDIAIGQKTGVKYAALSQTAGGGTSQTKGIFRSLDGNDWTNVTPAEWPATYGRIVLDIAPSNENIAYFLVSTNAAGAVASANLWKYEYLSGDGTGDGGKWTNLTSKLPMLGGKSGDLNLQGGYNMVIKVKPTSANVVVLGGTNLYLSINGFASAGTTRKIGGYSFSNQDFSLYPDHHPDQHEVVFFPSNPDKVISAHDGGLSLTTNIANEEVKWSSLNKGYLTTQFYTVAMDLNTTDDFVVGGMQDNGSWAVDDINETTVWYEQLGGDGAFAAVATHSLLVSVQNGTVYRFIFGDDGEYLGYSRIDPPKATGYLFINPYNIDPNNEYTLYLPAGDSLWRNKDISLLPRGGEQSSLGWEVVAKLGLTETISSVSVSKVPADIVYFGTTSGRLYKLSEASSATPIKTEVTGSNFPKKETSIGSGIFLPVGNIGCIAIDPRNADRALVVFTNYRVQSLYYTENGGISWTPVGGNLEQYPNGSGNGVSTRWASILPENGSGTKFFVGTSTGLYSTSALQGFATTWLREGNTTIGQVPVDMVISRTTDFQVLVGTHGNGVYSRRYAEPLSSPEDIAKVTSKTLGQSYPNPFRKGTASTIPFKLEKTAQVKVQVFDLNGRPIVTLVNGKLPAGQHTAKWDGTGSKGQSMPSGTYLYQLTVDGRRYTSRTVFIK